VRAIFLFCYPAIRASMFRQELLIYRDLIRASTEIFCAMRGGRAARGNILISTRPDRSFLTRAATYVWRDADR